MTRSSAPLLPSRYAFVLGALFLKFPIGVRWGSSWGSAKVSRALERFSEQATLWVVWALLCFESMSCWNSQPFLSIVSRRMSACAASKYLYNQWTSLSHQGNTILQLCWPPCPPRSLYYQDHYVALQLDGSYSSLVFTTHKHYCRS